MWGSRFKTFGVLVTLGAVLAACGGGGGGSSNQPDPMGSEQSRRAIASTGIQAGATPPPEGTDPLAAAVINAVVAMAAKDRAALDGLSTSPLSDTDAEAALACTSLGTSAKLDGMVPKVEGDSAKVDVNIRMNMQMSIVRMKGTWELAKQGDGSWKFSAPPTCVRG